MVIKIIAGIVAVIVVIGAIMGAQTGDLDFWLAFGGAMLALFAGVFAMEAKSKEKKKAADTDSPPADSD